MAGPAPARAVGRAGLIALLAALALAAPAGAAVTPRASLPDIENEVMCVECGTALSVSQSPVADQERALIRRDIAAGKTKAQIKAHLVAEYGNEVLAEPRGGSFDWAAWAIPIAAVVLATGGVAVAARRWRRARVAGGAAQASAGDGPPAATVSAEDAKRLDAELASFDR